MNTSHPQSTGDLPMTDRRGLRVLTMSECRSRLEGAVLGRVAYASEGDVVILPVNFLIDGAGVAFRTAVGSKLQHAADGGAMAFEIDEHDPQSASGWSVLIQGTATLVDDEVAAERLDREAPSAWVPVDDQDFYWVHLRPHSVTGREIPEPPPRSPTPDAEQSTSDQEQAPVGGAS